MGPLKCPDCYSRGIDRAGGSWSRDFGGEDEREEEGDGEGEGEEAIQKIGRVWDGDTIPQNSRIRNVSYGRRWQLLVTAIKTFPTMRMDADEVHRLLKDRSLDLGQAPARNTSSPPLKLSFKNKDSRLSYFSHGIYTLQVLC